MQETVEVCVQVGEVLNQTFIPAPGHSVADKDIGHGKAIVDEEMQSRESLLLSHPGEEPS